MSTFLEIAAWIWAHVWQICGLFFILWYRKTIYKEFIFTPLAGGNGKIQNNELAQGIILLVFVFCAYVEGTRVTEHHVFTDPFWFALLGTVAVIAGIKQGIQLYKRDKTNEPPKP